MKTLTLIIAVLLAGCSPADDTETTPEGAGGAEEHQTTPEDTEEHPCAGIEDPQESRECTSQHRVDPNAEALAECYEEGAETYAEAKVCVNQKLGRLSMGGGR